MASALQGVQLGSVMWERDIDSGAAVRLPNAPCLYVAVKAGPANSGVVYVGKSSGVTAGDGSDDATTGWPLSAGQETPWLPVRNANQLYAIGSADNQRIHIMTLQPG